MRSNEEKVLDAEAVRVVLNMLEDNEFDTMFQILLKKIPEEKARQELNKIVDGRQLPSLMSNVIAKEVFGVTEYMERIEYLLRELTGDNRITITKEDIEEGRIKIVKAKNNIIDVSENYRQSNKGFYMEEMFCSLQPEELDFSSALELQYLMDKNRYKQQGDYLDGADIIRVFLMKRSPKRFQEHPSEKYIHRFKPIQADTGFSFGLKMEICVQLDKCLEQFQKGVDGENNPELQLLLTMIADINNEKAKSVAEGTKMMNEIYTQITKLSKQRDVQIAMLAELFAD